MNIGIVIKDFRKRKGLNQGELAQKCGVTQTYFSQIENGKKVPGVDLLNKISEILGVPTSIIMFLSLEIEEVKAEKREAYKQIAPALHAMVKEFFAV